MKLSIHKLLPIFLLPLAMLVSSCADTENLDENAQNGYVELTIKRTSSGNTEGYQTYRFALPPNGANKIYAEKCTADDNANVDQYIIRALSAEDVPFNAIEVHVTCAKYTENESSDAKATIRLAQYDESYASANTSFFWTVPESSSLKSKLSSLGLTPHELTSSSYSTPLTEGGIFTFDFKASADHGVYEAGYNNNTSNYPLLSIKIAAPVKRY